MGSGQLSVVLCRSNSTNIMKFTTCLVLLLVLTALARSQPQYFGASNPAPCCRSDFPDEFGSCRVNGDCPQPTAPYCSAFGYCTHIQRYGYDGCAPCQHYASVAPHNPYH